MISIGITSSTGTAKKRTLPGLVDSPVCRVSAIHGRNPAALKDLASKFHVPKTYSNLGDMAADKSIDLFYVASPPFLHAEEIKALLPARKPIICEKPLAHSLEDAAAIFHLISSAGIPFMLAHHVRHQAATAYVRDIVNSRALGPARACSIRWDFKLDHSSRNARWKLRPELGGPNSLYDSGSHAIDLALFLFGTPAAATAAGAHILSADTFDLTSALLLYDRLHVSVSSCQSSATFSNDLVITFDDGKLTVPGLLSESSAREVLITDPTGFRSEKFELENLYRNEVENFVRHLSAPNAPFVGTTLREALDQSEVLATIDRSIAKHTTVEFIGVRR